MVLIWELSWQLMVLISKNTQIDNAIPFILSPRHELLQEILTIGYPPVPFNKNTVPLYHLGEINSRVETYRSHKLFLYSAKTNPDNSGSPIIDSSGMVVGVVTEKLEEDGGFSKCKTQYYTGIPACEIDAFLNRDISLRTANE